MKIKYKKSLAGLLVGASILGGILGGAGLEKYRVRRERVDMFKRISEDIENRRYNSSRLLESKDNCIIYLMDSDGLKKIKYSEYQAYFNQKSNLYQRIDPNELKQ